MFGIGMPEFLVILVIALIIFGPGKLPDIGNSIGKTIRGFKKAMEEPGKGEDKKPDSQENDKKITGICGLGACRWMAVEGNKQHQS